MSDNLDGNEQASNLVVSQGVENVQATMLSGEYRHDNGNHVYLDGLLDLTNVITPDGPIMDSAGNAVRLSDVMRCVVCKSVPSKYLLQCQNGHLICASCYQIRVLNKMLGSQIGTCPTCSVRIYRHLPNRNLVAEHALADVQTVCEFCHARVKRSTLREHIVKECPNTLVFCKYRRIGCQWNGMKSQFPAHESECSFPNKTGAELREGLVKRQAAIDANWEQYRRFKRFTQMPNISVRLLQVLPCLERMPVNEFKNVAQFQAYSSLWWLLLKVDTEDDDGDNLASIIFKLRLASPVDSTVVLSYSLLHGTYSEVRFMINCCERFAFSNENMVGPGNVIYRHTTDQCMKLLTDRGIFARLLMARG